MMRYFITQCGGAKNGTCKNEIKIFKEVRFKIEIQTHLKIVNFLDVTFILANGAHRSYKKPNDSSLYINTSSNHPPQVIKLSAASINEGLNKNSSSEKRNKYNRNETVAKITHNSVGMSAPM